MSRLELPSAHKSEQAPLPVRTMLALVATGAVVASPIIEVSRAIRDYDATVDNNPAVSMDYEPRNVCDVPPAETWRFKQDDLRRSAEQCIDARKVDVAVVGFGGMSIDRLTEITHEASRAVTNGFDGIVAPRLVPILASAEAEKAFGDINEDCVDSSDIERYASRIADNTMQLSEYANVVALTDSSACADDTDPGPKGVSHGAFDSKYIDVYDVPTDEPESTVPEPTYQGAVIAHEIGHGLAALRLDHAGSLVSGSTRESIRLRPGFSTEPVPSVVDVSKLVVDNKFEEYGEIMNIMGSHTINATRAELNTVQLRKLLWPERILNDEQDPMVMINGTNARIERSDDQLHKFAALQLDSPVDAVTVDKNGKEHRDSFDQLILDPLVTSEHGPDSINVQIFLVNSKTAQSLHFSNMVGSKNSPEELVIHIQNHSVSVSLGQNDSFFVTDISE